jgi:twinfilin-like protein
MFGAALVLKVSDDAKAAVTGAAEASVRAIKIVVDKETLVAGGTVPETESLEEDFKSIQAILDDDKPCIVLVRLKGSPNHQESDWALIAYTPDNAPVKQRMMNASSVKPIKEALGLPFMEYQITDKDEVTLKGFSEATHVMTEQERRECMSREERQVADVKKEQLKEQAARPRCLRA